MALGPLQNNTTIPPGDGTEFGLVLSLGAVVVLVIVFVLLARRT